MSAEMIGQRILEIRGKDSRKVFADKLDVGTATLQRYENGEREPDLQFLLNLQSLTGLSLDYLVHGKEAGLPSEEEVLLSKYRQSDAETRQKILLLLLGGEVSVNLPKSPKQNIKARKIGNLVDGKAHVKIEKMEF